ncbi:adenylate kinase [Veronia nyctiphanis]|uniref:Adenylate kinase n=1 Tax=Veronia nyctiphanis TaxID=1278244 RepID=A0A4Q0YUF4_9GAMM|nr:adenylate kinase [Veronia nyctiphanis]RXJ74413.1 adenylate kinase [Veronia nyctiphanis]
MLRIKVVGTNGSGKSYFSAKLSRVLNVPYIEMDAHYWRPDWQTAPSREFVTNLKTAMRSSSWVMDGNYDHISGEVMPDVDTLIWLDYSFSRTVSQALRSAVNNVVTRKEMWAGNRETLKTAFFSKDSRFISTVKTYHQTRRHLSARVTEEGMKHLNIIRLKHPDEAAAFLSAMQPAKQETVQIVS